MSETGIIKFSCEHIRRTLEPFPGFEELNKYRSELRLLGLLGVDENGIGFGNMSVRDGRTSGFYITGSGSGALPILTFDDFARVTDYDFEKNWLRCEGIAVASSESLTHAAIYETDMTANAVIHFHSEKLWKLSLNRMPTTSQNIEYGTPAIATEVKRLFAEGCFAKGRVFVMGGHKGGIVSFGATVEQAFTGSRR